MDTTQCFLAILLLLTYDLLGRVDGNRLSCGNATRVTAPPSSPCHSCDSGLVSILINDHTPAMLTPLFIRVTGTRLDPPTFLLSLFPVIFHFQPIIFISMNGPERILLQALPVAYTFPIISGDLPLADVWYYPETDVRPS